MRRLFYWVAVHMNNEAMWEKWLPNMNVILYIGNRANREVCRLLSKKMPELTLSYAVIEVEDKTKDIPISKDILMRATVQNLDTESTPVEKVMTLNPECLTIDTPIFNALHTMHDGKLLHLPVIDGDGGVVAVADVMHITHATVATVSQMGTNAGFNNEAASGMMQKSWDLAMGIPETRPTSANICPCPADPSAPPLIMARKEKERKAIRWQAWI